MHIFTNNNKYPKQELSKRQIGTYLVLFFQVNTCPIDRSVFTTIIIFNRVGGHEIAREKCKQKIIEDNPEDAIADQDSVLCETCGCGDRSDVLLLCDGKTFFHDSKKFRKTAKYFRETALKVKNKRMSSRNF